MTSDARELTAGATGKDLIMASIVRSVVDVAEHAGIERAPLLARLGLKPSDFDDPDGLLPLEAYILAWEYIAGLPDQAELGLEVGKMSSPQFLGALGYAITHAPDGLSAIRMFHRFRSLVSNTLAPEIDIDDDSVTYHLVWPPRVARLVQFADCAFVGSVTLIRNLLNLPETVPLAREAHYQCARPPTGPDRASILGCPVHYGAPEMRLVFHRAPIERSLPRHDPALFAYLERHASSVLARVPAAGRTADQVRRLITEELRNGEPSQADVSRRLAMSERTLQRRLRDENTTFAEILDNARAELSQLYLREANVAAYEVAFLLGYSEPSAFHRAFRRWTGVTPQEFRRRC
ncbi:MAG TPA: AraC family transcriptional regulator ligand-binding domain-containing protein [Polyangiaceae bacterium]|nr:AraC family transcriptional regulator ligand-binding domain-containing protein [Polyangiaceae bacterium]